MAYSHKQDGQPVIVVEHKIPVGPTLPTHAEVAERAYQLWLQQGRPGDSAETNWLEAERELHDAALSRGSIQLVNEKGGSVQN